jgi:hypothetical protein
MTDKEQIPLHRRIGLRLLQFLIIVSAFLLIRNCILISKNSTNPDLEIQQHYYDKGYEAGRQKALHNKTPAEQHFPDLLLERKYREGLRDGWDATKP